MTRHLLVEISGHGYGHLGQTAPVVNSLIARLPDLNVTVRSSLSPTTVRGRFDRVDAFLHEEVDVGMHMASAVEVLRESSHSGYLRFHEGWDDRVAHGVETLEQLAPDLVLSNCSYLVLAAARQLGIPAVAMSSLNWADVYRWYCSEYPGFQFVHGQILSSYDSGNAFLALEPGMAMESLHNVRRIGPVALTGRSRRAEIDAALGIPGGSPVVLVDPGGIPTQIPLKDWPALHGVRWVAPSDIAEGCRQAVAIEELDLPFIDVLASCDALVTKPGYGMFVEAACHRVPVIYGGRADWPEEPHLSDWLERHGTAVGVPWHRIQSGDIFEPLEDVLRRPRPCAVEPTGIRQAVEYLGSFFR